MDPNYAVFADDLNRILSEKYECYDVSPVKFTGNDGEPRQVPRKVSNAQIASHIAYFVTIKDEYREPWWSDMGATPLVTLPLPIEMFESAAGLADEAKPRVEMAFEDLYREHQPKTGSKKKSKAS